MRWPTLDDQIDRAARLMSQAASRARKEYHDTPCFAVWYMPGRIVAQEIGSRKYVDHGSERLVGYIELDGSRTPRSALRQAVHRWIARAPRYLREQSC